MKSPEILPEIVSTTNIALTISSCGSLHSCVILHEWDCIVRAVSMVNNLLIQSFLFVFAFLSFSAHLPMPI